MAVEVPADSLCASSTDTESLDSSYSSAEPYQVGEAELTVQHRYHTETFTNGWECAFVWLPKLQQTLSKDTEGERERERENPSGSHPCMLSMANRQPT